MDAAAVQRDLVVGQGHDLHIVLRQQIERSVRRAGWHQHATRADGQAVDDPAVVLGRDLDGAFLKNLL